MADSTSTWGFTTGWFTPASLFLFLNLVIGIIAITSHFGYKRREHGEPRPLARAPSLIERVKSINLSFYYNYLPPNSETVTESATGFEHNTEAEYTTGFDRPAPLQRAPSLLERVKSIKLSSFYRSELENEFSGEPESDSHEDMISQEQHHVKRSISEPKMAPERKNSKKMKKSVSERAVAAEKEEEKESAERRRPETTRLERMVSFGDDGVDAKADDFINRFKQQLKLQRLDSLLRYKEMLRGK